MILELCIESMAEALMAVELGIPRVELCSALDLEGLSPSGGTVFECCKLEDLDVRVMVRPRAGDFCYSEEEIAVMEADIYMASRMGVQGVVLGVLTQNGDLDVPTTKRLVELAKSSGLEVTFHRAFDVVNDPFQCLDQLIELGVDRVLTSGQEPTAPEGIGLIEKLVEHAAGRISVMPGAGIDSSNALDFQKIGCKEIHFASRKPLLWDEKLNMGKMYQPDREKASSIVELFK